ncbi:glycoside hydrolase family 13 protein [Leifsonia poae]|uniref:glycoside hydrolase family 13 protein n=1 Tax=Leifsonia poae TaxID=110933 RepID=UPI001CBDC5C4|nr:glycoside hydrolase family 13 protein [Leifsonia poae]
MVTESVLNATRVESPDRWWRQAAVYQVYPRSFADGNGDGVGDFLGLISRIDYLRDLGIDAVWLSPFYPSELADGGYDVADYRDVDPRIGTLADFDALVARLHDVDIKVIVDIVPNHSSDQHAWFQEALRSVPGSAARDRYIFRDGRGPDGSEPPSDWTSIFGGPAWTRVPDGQWYLHLFAREQPDWNWSNPEVRQDFLTTLEFWADRGVDGFRVDVAHALTKGLGVELPTQVQLEDPTHFPVGTHPIWDRDEVHEIYAEWRRLFDRYTPPLTAVAEAWVPAERRIRYATEQGLGQAFNFDLLKATWDAAQFRRIVEENLDLSAQSGSSSTWVFSNHDMVRHATRFGLPSTDSEGHAWLLSHGVEPREDRDLGLRRANAATLLAMALPGSVYLYQGEELGLPEVADIPGDDRQDPTFFRTGGQEIGRDGCRVPLPWTADGPSFGFGAGGAHLPQPAWFAEFAVDTQSGRSGSVLSLYQDALAGRRMLQTDERLEWLDIAPDVVAFRRPNGWTSATNFGSHSVTLEAERVYLFSDGSVPTDGPVRLEPDTTVWYQHG